MPEWVHNRAEHLLAKNPSMPKHMAFAIATQQGEAGGHVPKGFGTAEGRRTSKAKFSTPKDDEKKANPGGLESPKMASVGQALVTIMHKVGFSPSPFGGQPAQNPPGMKGQSQVPPFVAPPLEVKAAGVGVGAGMSTSQYSGPLSFGPFKQTSGIPPFQRPPLTAPADEKTAAEDHSNRNLMLAGGAGYLGGGAAIPAFGHAMQNQAENFVSSNPERAAELASKLKSHSPVPVHEAPIGNAYYVSNTKSRLAKMMLPSEVTSDMPKQVIMHGKGAFGSAPVLAHEMGHADLDKHLLGRVAQSTTLRSLGGMSPLLGAATGLASGMKSDEHSDARKWGLAAPALAQVPTLASEGGATALGLRRLAREGASKGELWRAAKPLASAFGTYGGRAAAGVGLAALAQGVGGRIRKNRQNDVEKSAAPMASATGAMGPKTSLTTTQRVGQPKTTGFAGPSIADVSKPKGFGTPLSGALKNQL